MTKPISKRRGEQAIEAMQQAKRIDARSRAQWSDDIFFKEEAKHARESAKALLEPHGTVVEGAGEAVAWDPSPGAEYDATLMQIVNSLDSPDSVSIGASDRRLRAVTDGGVWNLPWTRNAQRGHRTHSRRCSVTRWQRCTLMRCVSLCSVTMSDYHQ